MSAGLSTLGDTLDAALHYAHPTVRATIKATDKATIQTADNETFQTANIATFTATYWSAQFPTIAATHDATIQTTQFSTDSTTVHAAFYTAQLATICAAQHPAEQAADTSTHLATHPSVQPTINAAFQTAQLATFPPTNFVAHKSYGAAQYQSDTAVGPALATTLHATISPAHLEADATIRSAVATAVDTAFAPALFAAFESTIQTTHSTTHLSANPTAYHSTFSSTNHATFSPADVKTYATVRTAIPTTIHTTIKAAHNATVRTTYFRPHADLQRGILRQCHRPRRGSAAHGAQRDDAFDGAAGGRLSRRGRLAANVGGEEWYQRLSCEQRAGATLCRRYSPCFQTNHPHLNNQPANPLIPNHHTHDTTLLGTVFWQTGLGSTDFVGGHTLVAAEERALVVDNGGPQTVTMQVRGVGVAWSGVDVVACLLAC